MKIVKDKITIGELKEMAKKMYDNLVKAVVDVEKEIMAIDAGMHSDEQEFLMEQGSKVENLWGINILPDKEKDNWIEFDSLINIKPAFNNRIRGVSDEKIREKIIKIVNNLIKE